MICTATALSFRTSIQACLNASLLQQACCGNSFLALGQGGSRKAF
jgi:hypothetical protein